MNSPTMIHEALAIADEAMQELLVSACLPGDNDSSYRMMKGTQVVNEMSAAEPEVAEAFDWLSRRGLARLVEEGEITWIHLIRQSVAEPAAPTRG